MMSTSGLVLQENLVEPRYQAPIVIATIMPACLSAEHTCASRRSHENAPARARNSSHDTDNLHHCIRVKCSQRYRNKADFCYHYYCTVLGQGKIMLLMFLCAIILGELGFFSWRPVIGGLIAVGRLMMCGRISTSKENNDCKQSKARSRQGPLPERTIACAPVLFPSPPGI